MAKVGVALGQGANLEAAVGPKVNTVTRVAHEMYVPCPLMDPCQEGESLSGTLKWKQAPKETLRTTLLSPQSLMW